MLRTTPARLDATTNSAIGENRPGRVVIDTEATATADILADIFADVGPASLGAVVLHEPSHAQGHVDDETQLTFPTTTDKPSELAAGDRAGLRQLGPTGGVACPRVPDPRRSKNRGAAPKAQQPIGKASHQYG
jgi:hypothetical protein